MSNIIHVKNKETIHYRLNCIPGNEQDNYSYIYYCEQKSTIENLLQIMFSLKIICVEVIRVIPCQKRGDNYSKVVI